MKNYLAVLVLSAVATVSQAALIGISASNPQIDAAPAGFTVHDLLIDFEGRLFGQQMVVQLSSGSIYQDPLGSDTGPSPAFFPIFPSVEADTFVTIGGLHAASSADVLVVGGSTELGKNGPKQFDESGINIAWAPAPGVVIDGGRDFPIARLTLSSDARGNIFFYSNSGGTGVATVGHIRGDVICSPCPEPTAAVLTCLAMIGFGCGRRG